MDRRVLLLLSLIVALEVPITKPRIYARALNTLPIILYGTDAELSTLNVTNNDKLHLMGKNFNDLSHDEFQSNTHLKKLIISEQIISQSWLQEKDYLFASATLQEFYLTASELPWLPANAFARMPNLTFLSLANNQLKDVRLGSLTQLETLDLSTNLFSHISGNLREQLTTLRHLRTLDLANNLFSTLGAIKSASLVKLDVSGNIILSIQSEDLVGLPALDTLIIARNGLQLIDPLAFAKTNRLTALDLNNNNELTNLPIFEMSQSGQKAYGLFSLDCANCGINEITPRTLNTLTNLVKLNLARNNLKILPVGFFGNLTSLQSLDLTNNSISWIPNGMFTGAKSLNFLSLEGNPLMKLSPVPFLMTPRLSTLNVARCGLKHLWDTTNGVLKSLKTVSVAGNSIKGITEQELAVTPNLQHMDISGNSFGADKEFIIRLENKKVSVTALLQYRRGRWSVKRYVKKGRENLQNSTDSSLKDRYNAMFTKQVVKITIEPPKNQMALDELENAEFVKVLKFFGFLMIGLFVAAAAIGGLAFWCCRDKSSNEAQFKLLPDVRNLLKSKKSTNVEYEPLEEDVVKTITHLEIKLTE